MKAIQQALIVAANILMFGGTCFAQLRAIDSLKTSLARTAEHYEAAGFSGCLLVTKGSEILLARGCGFRDRDAKLPNTLDTCFEIASLSKPFTAMAVLFLQEDGKVDIHRPLRQYLPEVPDRYSHATVFHVLIHCSGMPRGGSGRGMDATEAIRAFLSEGPEFSPGQKVSYSNSGYAVLAALVERVSGQTLEEFCRQRIFVPAEMEHTGFCGESMFAKEKCAIGYHGNEKSGRLPHVDPYPPLDQFGYEYRGMGGVVTTAEDLQRFVRAFNEHRLVSAETETLMRTEFLDSRSCGWEVFTFEEGIRCISHGGGVRGYTSKLWMFPEQDASLILLSNNDQVDYQILTALYHEMFAAEIKTLAAAKLAVKRGAASVDAQHVQPLLGSFLSDGNVSLRISVDNGAFTAELSGGKAKPPADPVEEAALAIVEGLSRKDPSPLRERLPERMNKWPHWPDTVVHQQWPAVCEANGDFKSVELVGSLRGPVQYADETQWRYVWLRLHFSNNTALSLLTFNDAGEMETLVLDVQREFFGTDSTPRVVRRLSPTDFELAPEGRDVVTLRLRGETLHLKRGSLWLEWER